MVEAREANTRTTPPALAESLHDPGNAVGGAEHVAGPPHGQAKELVAQLPILRAFGSRRGDSNPGPLHYERRKSRCFEIICRCFRFAKVLPNVLICGEVGRRLGRSIGDKDPRGQNGGVRPPVPLAPHPVLLPDFSLIRLIYRSLTREFCPEIFSLSAEMAALLCPERSSSPRAQFTLETVQ